jgi:cytidylate kinase
MPKDKLKGGFVVTIDGPAASGKTSVSREVARRLGWRWVSTGAFYRGLAFLVKSHQIDVSDEAKIAELIRQAAWEVRLSPERTQVFVNGEDVTEEIYREEVGETASLIGQFPSVRSRLLKAQRDCRLGVKGLVAEGRDCGTVVFSRCSDKNLSGSGQCPSGGEKSPGGGIEGGRYRSIPSPSG